MKIRSFISLDLPLSLKHELSGHAKLIAGQDKRQKIRWLPPENYHLTLVFLGEIESTILSGLQFALELKLESTKAVPLTISAITPFPFSRTRIAAALVEHATELLQLQSNVTNCVRKCGITPERRRFVPHVTLGRLKPRAGKTVDFKVRNILLSGIADSVTLFQSELTPDGAIHTALAEIPMRTLPE
jgi:2'-5' RNA ligase